MSRVVVVLGYSDGGDGVLHPVCASRLAHAASICRPDDVVVLSGWARAQGIRAEAELMREAWAGDVREVVVDPVARTTAENAANALGDVRRVRAGEIVVVTSRWHARRAGVAFRALLRGTGVRVTASSPPERPRVLAAVRELGLFALLPLQLSRARGPRRVQ